MVSERLPQFQSSPVERAERGLEELDPAYFGFVMSTGIISIAFHGLGADRIAGVLGIITVVSFSLLLVLFAVRVVRYPGRMARDLRDRDRHWGSLTFLVATNTVGAQLLTLEWAIGLAPVLWVVTIVGTPLLLYYLFGTEFVGARKVSVRERIDGAFLLVIVCMQSLAILGGMLAERGVVLHDTVVLLSMSYFGAGVVLYVVVVTVVTYRLLDGGLVPADWTGPYWITMGAAAITTLAGSTLGAHLQSIPAWTGYAPVFLAVTFLAWAIASWWIPLLIAMDVWAFRALDTDGSPPVWVGLLPWARLGFGRRLHTYDPTAWGRVFPMGMYTASTVHLGGIGTFSLLSNVPMYWAWFALLVWALTCLGMVRAMWSLLSADLGASLDGRDTA
jgi:tellurite resistance protein TehA-like permease